MFSYMHNPTPHGAGGGGDGQGGGGGEEVTVKQAVAASAATLQQCGLLGAVPSPGTRQQRWRLGQGLVALAWGKGLHRAGLPSGEGKSLRPSEMMSWHRAAPQSSARRKAQQRCQCLRAPCSAPARGRLCSLRPGSSRLLAVVSGLPAMALSQSLILAYPPLTSFRDSAADARDFRALLCAVQTRANAGGYGAAARAEKRV